MKATANNENTILDIATNISPIMPTRKLSDVPFPEKGIIKAIFAAGVVVGAITAID
jgi:hypothetical protein